jgi:hypothetical protein
VCGTPRTPVRDIGICGLQTKTGLLDKYNKKNAPESTLFRRGFGVFSA